MKERLKLNSIDDLNKYDFIILNKQTPIKNNLKRVLEEKGLNQSDLSKLTGICRQNISEIINNEMIPGVVLASQIATVLNKQVEELFELTEDAWVEIAKFNKDITIYIDLYELELIINPIRKDQIRKDKLEYIDLIENKCITKEEYTEKLNNFLSKKTDNNGNIKWQLKKSLLEEFETFYVERYRKLGKRITPIIINK